MTQTEGRSGRDRRKERDYRALQRRRSNSRGWAPLKYIVLALIIAAVVVLIVTAVSL